ncbi:MAG TPA: phosphatidylinositol-specific phospholipase C [Kofleriaceae bacterium]|nr:phosphatidylinositol-specific phospholipase C [Kofleriaceae bacterium]
MRSLFCVCLGIGLAACASDPVAPPDPGSQWMTSLDDAAPLASLSIPGTHETLALLEPIPSSARCQRLALADQLAAGVRFLDVRCRHLGDSFAIYHGPVFEQLTFDDVLATVTGFLDAHPGETVVMSIKEESLPSQNTRSFEATFAAYVAADPARWYLGADVPALGDVRGKIVLLRRFAAAASPLGIDGSAWADNTTFSLDAAGARLRVQDAYVVTSNAAKWNAIASLLAEASTPSATLYLDYTSGYQMPGVLPDIASVADVINPELDAYLADPAHATAHLGVIANDFMTEGRALKIAQTNLRP